MNKKNRQKLSMFSKETLDSLEMAEVLGGDNNTNCVNKGCNTSCTNTCTNQNSCVNDKCFVNTECTDDSNCPCASNTSSCINTDCSAVLKCV